jgi:hypothetical protein
MTSHRILKADAADRAVSYVIIESPPIRERVRRDGKVVRNAYVAATLRDDLDGNLCTLQ